MSEEYLVDPANKEEFQLWEPRPLKLKVDAFGRYAKENEVALDGSVIKNYFLPKQVSGLWQMLKGKVKKCEKPVQEAWGQIKSSAVRGGKDHAKTR